MAAEPAKSCNIDQTPIDPAIENEALGPLVFQTPSAIVSPDNEITIPIQEGGEEESLAIMMLDNTFEIEEPVMQKLITKIQTIHCNAFGSHINGLEMTAGSTAAKRKLKPLAHMASINPAVPRNATIPPRIALLVRRRDGALKSLNDIIIITILSTGAQTAAGRDIEIWSVCKNPASTEPNAFHSFLTLYHIQYNKDKNGNPICNMFRLIVDSSNTPRMTEDARLRLYRYCGFQIAVGSAVTLVYPSTEIWTVTQSLGSYVKIRAANGQERCVYFAYCRAAPGSMIVMEATCEAIQCIVPLEIQHVEGETNNARVDISPYLPYVKGLHESGAPQYLPICAKYHQSIHVDEYGFTECVDVPENFIVVSFSSPGSLLYFNNVQTDGLILELSRRSLEGGNVKYIQQLILENRSTAVLPLSGLTQEENFRKTFLSTEARVGCEIEKNRSLSAASVIQRMGKQPIMQVGRNMPENTVKQYQIDVQVYTGGMKMFNTSLSRTTSDYVDPATKDAAWKKKQQTDDITMGMKLAYLKPGAAVGAGAGAGAGYTLAKIDDRDFANQAYSKRLSDLFAYLQKRIFVDQNIYKISYPPIVGGDPAQTTKVIVYLYGCGNVSGTSYNISKPDNYSLLYELSHRRSIIYDGGADTPHSRSIRMNTSEFIDNFILNKSLRGAVVCPAAGGSRKYRHSNRMATRFRKLRTRRVLHTKALKTRKHRGGDYGPTNYMRSLTASIVPESRELLRDLGKRIPTVRLPSVTLSKFTKTPTTKDKNKQSSNVFASAVNPFFKPNLKK